jgi:hypothetical protein
MKKFWLYFRGWLDEPFNFFTAAGLCVIGLIFIALHFKHVYPDVLWITIFGNITAILFFALLSFAGIISMRSRTLPIFIIPVEGVPAVIMGGVLTIGSSYLAIFILYKTISLLFSIK